MKTQVRRPVASAIAVPRVIAVALVLCGALPATAETPPETAEMRALGRCAGCVIAGQDFREDRLTSIDLRGATLTDVQLDGAQLNLAVFQNATLTRVSFAGANLSGAIFVGARLVDVSFAGANLRGAVFEDAQLERTQLDTASLCNTQTPGDKMDNSGCDTIWQSPAAAPASQ